MLVMESEVVVAMMWGWCSGMPDCLSSRCGGKTEGAPFVTVVFPAFLNAHVFGGVYVIQSMGLPFNEGLVGQVEG